jgi:hypothetical protein
MAGLFAWACNQGPLVQPTTNHNKNSRTQRASNCTPTPATDAGLKQVHPTYIHILTLKPSNQPVCKLRLPNWVV